MCIFAKAVLVAGSTVAFIAGAQLAPCPSDPVSVDLRTTADIQRLSDAMNCSGPGEFNVTWYNSLQLGSRIEVSTGKRLDITGSSSTGTPITVTAAPHNTTKNGTSNTTDSTTSNDPGDISGIFLVSDGSSLTITNMALDGGYSEDGGAVTVLGYSYLNVIDCVFTNNNASRNGGAIYANRSEVNIGGTTKFVNNLAVDGGAIRVSESAVVIDGNTSFAFNDASFSGGAVHAYGSRVKIDGNTSFYNNTALQDAGAIYVLYEEVNIAGNDLAGAIETYISEVNISGDTVFAKNSGRYGGAVSLSFSAFRIDGNITFDSNKASHGGGAVRAHESSLSVNGTTSFYRNTGTVHGGAIYALYSSVSIDGTTSYHYNNGDGMGGAISADQSDVGIVGHTSFAHNSAISFGGALRARDSTVNIDGYTSFKDNTGPTFGGAVSAFYSTVSIAGDYLFADNSATEFGGAIAFYSTEAKIEGTAYLTYSELPSFRGGTRESNATAYIDGITHFSKNSALIGGAMYAGDKSHVHISGSTVFVGNPGADHGGAIFSMESEVNIEGNTTFVRNSAAVAGGAIRQHYGNLTIDGDATFIENSAATGGAVDSYLGNITVRGDALFIGNIAGVYGGSIVLAGTSSSNITSATFTANDAKLGGAIALTSTDNNDRTYDKCVFADNTAEDGGAIYMYGGSGSEFVTDSVFRDNYASTSGGAIYLLAGSLELNSTSFLANQAGQEGMAVNAASVLSLVRFGNVTFKDNAYHCPLGQYANYASGANVSRYETVCRRCSTIENHLPDGVEVDNESMAPSCQELPIGTTWQSSGTTVSSLTLKEGYYRTSNASTSIVECYRQESCVGGDDPDKYCAAGYKGAYCAVCAENFSARIGYGCGECSAATRQSALGLMATAFVVIVLVTALIVKDLRRVSKHDTSEGMDVRRGFVLRKCSIFQGSLMKVLPLTAIKTVVVVWQIVYQFSAIAGDVYPEEYDRLLSYLSFANVDIGMIVSYSCLFSPNFYERLLLATIVPAVVVAVLAGAYSSLNRNMVAARSRLLSATLFFLFFVYSSVSYKIFQTFLCDPLDDGNVYLQADYSLTCSTKRHRAYTIYAGLMIIVYPIGIPAFFGWWLVRNRTYLKKSDRQTEVHLQPFAGIWGTYKPSRYYYEVVEYSRRLVLTMASVFLVPNSVNQIAVVLSLAVAFVFLSESMSPFEKSVDMSLYRWGNGVVLASMYVALLLKANESNDKSSLLSVFGGVLITANVAMIAAVVVQSVLLTKTWRASKTTDDDMFLPVSRSTPVTGPTAPVGESWYKASF